MAPPNVQAPGRFLVISTKMAFHGVRDLFFVMLQKDVIQCPVAALRGSRLCAELQDVTVGEDKLLNN